MSPFTVEPDQWACGPTLTTLSFVRATRDLNSAGETVLSFASSVAIRVDLQPEGGLYPRFLAGTLIQVNFVAIAAGSVDVAVGDRATVSGAQVEVVNVMAFGSEQTELALRWVR